MDRLPFRQVHLDFHTSEKIVGVGEKFDAEEFAHTLKEAHVNSITCFSRCHHGMIYHDTKFVEARHPHLKINLLAEQILACHAVGIRVPIYISVGFDQFMAKRHPEWREITPEGGLLYVGPLEAGWHKLCLNSPYVEYVFEQTKEVLSIFQVDGLFFDIISQGQCCCNFCMDDMIREGLNPEKEADRRAFADKVVLEFRQRMTGMVREINKECGIFYNSGHVSPKIRTMIDTYTHLEFESLPSGQWGYHYFPIAARYGRGLGLEYLGMTGKFLNEWGDFGSFKNKAALEYECFTFLSLGAKCSIGDQMHPNGRLDKSTYRLIGSVYESVEEKEQWCTDVEPLVEIAVMNPEVIEPTFIKLDDCIKGAYRMLEESHYQFDVIDTQMDFSKYRLIIFPDKIRFDESLGKKVERYLAEGGSILMSHMSGLGMDTDDFAIDNIDITCLGQADYSPDFLVAEDKIANDILPSEHVMYDRGVKIKPSGNTEILATTWNPYFNRAYKHFCSHRHSPVAEASEFPCIVKSGNIIYFSYPVFGMYQRYGARVYKQLVLNCIRLLIDDKLIVSNLPTIAHVTLNYQEKQRRYVVHILNYIPERRANNIDTIEDIVPLYDVRLSVKLPQKPVRAYLAPSITELSIEREVNYSTVTIPRVLGHQMVVFDVQS